jgi:RNA recognition motif-containing protein
MQLFIGRLPMDMRASELEDIFIKHGKLTRCDIKVSKQYVVYHLTHHF